MDFGAVALSYSKREVIKNMSIKELLGKTIVIILGADVGKDDIEFICDDGSIYRMYHEQDCCEEVCIVDICGDINALIDSPITMAEDISNQYDKEPDKYVESYTWTWYKFATVKGYVTIRWLGESNGYYSEAVDFVQIR